MVFYHRISFQIANQCSSVTCTKLDLAEILNCERITVETFTIQNCRIFRTLVVRTGLAHCHDNTRRNLSDSRQLTNFLPNTIGNNKREILISLLYHLRATQTCESTIKGQDNNQHLHTCVRVKTSLLYSFSHVSIPIKEQLVTN